MWRHPWILIVLLLLTACGNDATATPDTVATRVAATLTALPPAATETRPPATATDIPVEATTAPTPTRDPVVWNAILGYQDVGVPLPKSARTFGGGVYVPQSAVQDIQTAQFTDELLLGVGGYFPNNFEGDTPLLLPDGTGIQSVSFYLFDPNGTIAYQTIDDQIPFCLTGDDGDQCTPFVFEENECQWLTVDGIPPTAVTAGFHQLNVVLAGLDGTEEVWFVTLDLLTSPDSPCATAF